MGQSQSLPPKFQLETSAGVFFHDAQLAFDASPGLALGADYRVSDRLRLGLDFAYTPTRQAISLATTTVAAKYGIYHVAFHAILRRPGWRLWRVEPRLLAGLGFLIINPRPVELDLGSGGLVRVEPAADYLVTADLGGSLTIAFFHSTSIKLEYRRSFYRASDGVPEDRGARLTHNNRLSIGFLVGLK